MEFCKNCMIILNYLVFGLCIIGEIVCLFLIPYYRYSKFLQNLKITRIILGIFLILIDCYFRANFFAELLSKNHKKIKTEQNLLDKILDISGLSISIIGCILNLIGVITSFDYIDTNAKTDLQNSYSTGSLLLFVENLFFIFFWLFFSAYWFYNFRKSFGKKNPMNINERVNNIKDIGPPMPANFSVNKISL